MGRRQFILTIASLLALFGNYAKSSVIVIYNNVLDNLPDGALTVEKWIAVERSYQCLFVNEKFIMIITIIMIIIIVVYCWTK